MNVKRFTIPAMFSCLGLIAALAGCLGENENTTPEEVLVEQSRISLAAIKDLAERLDVPPSDISIVQEKQVTWRDGSLGCPKGGMMYTQALVDGTLIVLRVGDRDYHYHSANDGDPFYCENPVKPAPKSSLD